MPEGDDSERIGLSRSTVEGQGVAFAAGLSGHNGWRRTAAKVLAYAWLAAAAAGLLAAVVLVVLVLR